VAEEIAQAEIEASDLLAGSGDPGCCFLKDDFPANDFDFSLLED
jgi:hypothetical protein